MFASLSNRLRSVFGNITKRGALRERDVDDALQEIRKALIDADVALEAVRSLIERVREKAVQTSVLTSISPGQQVIKIVHDELVEALGGAVATNLRIDSPPAIILMVGLQGSGKTTTTAKLAKRLREREQKKPLLASLDTRRPAAMEQLAILGEKAGIDVLPIVPEEDAVTIARRACVQATRGGYDLVFLDTAGRMVVDNELMAESVAIRDATKPREIFLVADSLTGQDAARVAREFHDALGITGVILTRFDGDGRGGAALSMRAVTGQPIRFAGVGEGLDELEAFHPERIASRIIGQGDVISLVEKAQEQFEEAELKRTTRRLEKGRFDMNDMQKQLENLQNMGGANNILSMMPGLGRLRASIQNPAATDSTVRRQIAIIQSMTREERRSPDILRASRKRRIASGAGVGVESVNRLVKAHQQTLRMIRSASRMESKGISREGAEATLAQMLGGKGAFPPGGVSGKTSPAHGKNRKKLRHKRHK